MKVVEFLRTANLEEIVNKIVEPCINDEGFAGYDDWRRIFYSDLWDCSVDCPEQCKYLEQGHTYEDEGMNGACMRPYGSDCPYKINGNEVFKRILKEWFNKEI